MFLSKLSVPRFVTNTKQITCPIPGCADSRDLGWHLGICIPSKSSGVGAQERGHPRLVVSVVTVCAGSGASGLPLGSADCVRAMCSRTGLQVTGRPTFQGQLLIRVPYARGPLCAGGFAARSNPRVFSPAIENICRSSGSENHALPYHGR